MDEARTSEKAALTVFLCFVAALCEGFDVQAGGVAAGGLSREFRPTTQELGIFFSASGAGLIIGAILGGRGADRLGRKPVLVASLLVFGFFSLLTSAAPSIPLLTAARFLTGLGLGGAMPNLIALAADAAASRSRNTSIATAYVGMPVGGSLASLVAFLVPLEQWRAVFQVGGVAPVLVVPFLIAYLPAGNSLTPSVTGAVSTTRGMLRELFGQRRAFKTLLLWASFLLIVLTLHLMLNWLPSLLSARGLAKGSTAIAQAAFGAGGAAVALWLGALLDSHRQRTSIAVSIVSLPAILLLIALSPPRAAVLAVLACLLGGAILAQQVILYGVASAYYPAAARGTGIGAAVAVGRFGSLIGPLFAASLLAAGRTPSQVLIGVLPIVLACGVFVGLLGWQGLAAPAGRRVDRPLPKQSPS